MSDGKRNNNNNTPWFDDVAGFGTIWRRQTLECTWAVSSGAPLKMGPKGREWRPPTLSEFGVEMEHET